MKRINFFFIFLFVCILFVFPDTYNEVSGSGLYISSDPSGATVYIDGIDRGTTPYSNSSIRPGEYRIRVIKDGYAERRLNITVRRGSRIEINVDLEEIRGTVILEFRLDPSASSSLPFNPRVYVDGDSINTRNFFSFFSSEQRINLVEGWRTITVEAFGWERVTRNVYVSEGSYQRVIFYFTPAVFSMSGASLWKKRFNPRNPGALGTTEINFTVSAPGVGTLEVFTSDGELIKTNALAPFSDFQQKAVWDGRDSNGAMAVDGTYILKLTVWDDESEKKQNAEFAVDVDSSMIIRPHTIISGSSGLLYAAIPEALPAFSYQIEGATMIGKLLLRDDVLDSQPFVLALRISFLDNLELTAAFSLIPKLLGSAQWGAGAALKWVFMQPRHYADSGFTNGFGMAAQLSYGWSAAGPYSVFGMGTGVGLRLPMMYRIMSGETKNANLFFLDMLFSPLILWAGEKGLPDNIIPRLGVEGGLHFSIGSFAAGISGRWDYAAGAEGAGPVAAALEIKWFPSNFVISLSGTYWYSAAKNDFGLAAGVMFGILY